MNVSVKCFVSTVGSCLTIDYKNTYYKALIFVTLYYSLTYVVFPMMFLKLCTWRTQRWWIKLTAKVTSNLENALRLLKTMWTLIKDKRTISSVAWVHLSQFVQHNLEYICLLKVSPVFVQCKKKKSLVLILRWADQCTLVWKNSYRVSTQLMSRIFSLRPPHSLSSRSSSPRRRQRLTTRPTSWSSYTQETNKQTNKSHIWISDIFIVNMFSSVIWGCELDLLPPTWKPGKNFNNWKRLEADAKSAKSH